MMTRRLAAPLLCVALAPALLAADCQPASYPDEVRLYAVSDAPPARVARLVNNDGETPGGVVTLSVGVAMAISCRDNCEGTCVAPTFVIGDDSIAEVLLADAQRRTDDLYVLIAKGVGQTTVEVSTMCAEATYTLQVEAAE